MLPENENIFDYTTMIATALVVACGVASFSYRTYLARDFDAAAEAACSDQNALSGAYKGCLVHFANAAKLVSQSGAR
jgi:hypothetical protein